MKKYLLLLLLPLSLFSAQILSYNIYDRTDRVDLMITFDTPYSGIIKQSRRSSKIIIKLEDATIESAKIKKVSSRFLQSIAITPMQNETQIIATVPSSVKLIASKTADGYGLRLRFTTKRATTTQSAYNKSTQNSISDNLTNLPTKKGEDLSQSYYIVIAILIIGILILFYIKRKTVPQNKKIEGEKTPWLFNANTQDNQPAQTTTDTFHTQQSHNEVSIRFQKAIDANNTVVMLDFGKESYLVLMGNSNILLDKFHEDKPASQQEFESILQNRHDELENFLNGTKDTKQTRVEEKEPLQSYKERAASLAYNDEI